MTDIQCMKMNIFKKIPFVLKNKERVPLSDSEETKVIVSLMQILSERFANENVTFVVVESIDIKKLKQLSHSEKALEQIKFGSNGINNRVDWLRNSPAHFGSLYGDLPQYSKKYIRNIFTPIQCFFSKRGRQNVDYKSPYVNISGGIRHTTDQPRKYLNSIFFVGGSSVFGMGCEDKHTLPSSLQWLINQSTFLREHFSVFNLGVRGQSLLLDFYKIFNLKTTPGDIVILQGVKSTLTQQLTHLQTDKFLLISPDFNNREKSDDVFFDSGHIIYKGHYLLAEKIYTGLFSPRASVEPSKELRENTQHISKADKRKALNTLELKCGNIKTATNIDLHPEIRTYLKEIKPLAPSFGTVGATVVNCNPFTLGHKHFIKQAASQVDSLFVFVVEEDASYFDFKTRYKLVTEGVKGINNITVVRSGKFIMSSITYPEYFSKAKSETKTIASAALDLDIFGEYIAPILNISIRFIGSEDDCAITKQHNVQMQNILPTYGIKVEEMKRFKHNSQNISASLVRKYIERGLLEETKEWVPVSTFDVIKNIKI